jgi:hypothetical protein
MSPKLIKLLPIGLMLAQTIGYYVYRSHRGWQLDFNGRPRVKVSHRGAQIRVANGTSRLLTADSALVEFDLSQSWVMALAARGWFHLDAHLRTGLDDIDRRFFIRAESQDFADALIADADLRAWLLQLEAMLEAHAVKFQRLETAGRKLQMLLWVRRCKDLDACWRDLIDWLVVFDAALKATRTPTARRRGRKGHRPTRAP